jgi:hypothetical protein
MRVYSNDPYIERREQVGRYLPLIGFAVLTGALALTWIAPGVVWPALTLVVIGFLASVFGSYYIDRFVGPSAHHRTVPTVLKGLGDDYALLMYETPVPFVLVEPGGLTVILVKGQAGKVSYEGGRWRHDQGMQLLRTFAGQETLGKPHRDLADLVARLERYLEGRLPEGVEVPVRGVVLFTHDKVQVETEEAPVPTFWSSKLKGWLRGPGRLKNLPVETRRRLDEALGLT